MTLKFTFRAMAAENEIYIDHGDDAIAHRAAQAAMAEVARIEEKYSRYRDDSALSAINRGAGGAPVAIDVETRTLLDYADAVFRQSEGMFDITSGVLRRAWNYDSQELPTQQAIDALLPLIGWSRVERTPTSIRLPTPGMQIDFGGFGKEYASDRAAAVIKLHGVQHALVNLAGDLAVVGAHADGSPWQVAVRHPRAPDGPIAHIPVKAGGVATSGDYERYMLVDGKRYHHILNPRTGWPVNGLASVSVVAPSCLVAGSMTTIAMLKPESEALAWLASLDVPYLAIMQSLQTRTNAALA